MTTAASIGPIACLAWGSLLWKSGPLLLAGAWVANGPRLPLEFARVGDGGELAVVLCPGAVLQPTWWALLDTTDMGEAREMLRQREAVDPTRPEWIGSRPAAAGTVATAHDAAVRDWLACQLGVRGVVWTALPPRPPDHAEGRVPGADEAVAYLDSLRGDVRAHAEDYLRRVPDAVDTAYRRRIVRQLGWRAND